MSTTPPPETVTLVSLLDDRALWPSHLSLVGCLGALAAYPGHSWLLIGVSHNPQGISFLFRRADWVDPNNPPCPYRIGDFRLLGLQGLAKG